MVQVTITYLIDATNTGVAHDLACGCSLLDPNTGEELVMLPWWVVWNVPTGQGWVVTIHASGDIPTGTYTAIARAWADYTPGTKAGDLDSVGIVYYGGTGSLHPPILDEATQTLVITSEVSATINEFTINI